MSKIKNIRINDFKIEVKGNILIKGDISSGKTSLLKHVKDNIEEDYPNAKIALVTNVVEEGNDCYVVDDLIYKSRFVQDRLNDIASTRDVLVIAVEYPNKYSTNEQIIDDYFMTLSVDKSDVWIHNNLNGESLNIQFSLDDELKCL